LGRPTAGQLIGQQKGTIVSGDIRAEKHVLKETLAALSAEGVLAGVEAIVITGDLTNAAGHDEFAEFAELAEMLAGNIDPKQILVVPGNHDVPRDHGPADRDRYIEFLRVTRDLGLATPLLDGIDIDAEGNLKDEAHKHAHLVVGQRLSSCRSTLATTAGAQSRCRIASSRSSYRRLIATSLRRRPRRSVAMTSHVSQTPRWRPSGSYLESLAPGALYLWRRG
jgi:hypothetical protein